ncbi:MAG: hypothetical protein CL610_24310 [Anaerolineaceae bacterium]|nr:hypothetical protein [Anaerolineaceae bacterium]
MNTALIPILLLSEQSAQSEMICGVLKDQAEMTVLQNAQSALGVLETQNFRLVLIASNTNSPAVFETVAAARLYAPVIMIAENGDAAGAVQAMRYGAYDYLVPDQNFPAQIQQAIQKALNPADRALFRYVYDDAPVMMYLLDQDGVIRDVNTRCTVETGYPREALIGQHLTTHLTPISSAHVHETCLPRLWRDGRISNVAHQHRRQDGTVIDVLLSATTVRDISGQMLAVAVVQNITGQKQIERAEREQRVLAEALRDTTAALNSTLDFDEVLDLILANVARVVPYDTGNIMLIEAGRARMVRNQRASEPGLEIKVPTAAFAIEDTPTLYWMYINARPLAIPDTREYAPWVDLPQSAWIRSFVGAPIINDGQVIGYLTLNSATKDTFHRQHAERLAIFAHHAGIAIRNARLFDSVQRYAGELENRVARRTAQLNLERNQLHAILEATGEGIVYTIDGQIEYVNQAITRLTGYTLDELVGTPLSMINPSLADNETWEMVDENLKRGEIWRGETRLRRKDGSEFDAGITVSPSSQPGDRRVRSVSVVRDISQAKQLESEKSRFIATASHELRTPITNVLTRLYLMKRQPEKMHEHISVLDEVARRMQQLIEDLLDLSRFERGNIQLERQPMELQQILSDVVRIQYAEARVKNINLIIDLTPTPQYIEGDPERLAQVITNLVTNSLAYTPSGGQVRVALTTQDGNAIISVEDTGIGIPPEYLSRVFEPFVRVNDKIKGTGLGLSIAKEIVELHDGDISVTSEPGNGSCFRVTLKLMSVPA